MKTKNLLLAATAIVAFAMTVTAQTIPSYVPTNGLVAYYPLNQNGNDISGYGNNLIPNGNITYHNKNTISNSGCHFPGGNDYFTTPVSSWSLINNFQQGTVSFWVKIDSQYISSHYFGIGNSFIVKQKHGVGQDLFFGMQDGTTKIRMQISGVFPTFSATDVIGSTSLVPNVWYHVLGTWNGIYHSIYINGVLDGRVSNNIGISNRNLPDYFSIGSILYAGNGSTQYPSGAYGSMDKIAFYNRALTQQEITALYTGVPPCTPTSSITNLTIPSASLPYTWNGLTFNAAGSQTKNLTNASGCDSLATLNLTVNYTLPNYIPTNGLVGYWPFNGNANDESGNGNHGTVNGATYAQVVSNSKSGYGISSVSDKITLPTIQCNNILKYSVAGWFKKNSNPAYPNIDGTIFSQSNGCGGSNGLRLFIGTDNHIYFLAEQLNGTCNSVGKYNVNTNYNDGNWHFFVAMFESNGGTITSSNFTLNIDGVNSNDNLYLGSAIVAPIPNLTNSTTFGNVNSSVDGMVGNIDDFVIYNRILTQTEITQLYTNCVATTSTTNLTIPSTSIPYTWNGLTFNAAGSQTKHLTNAAGCDSTATLNLTVINTALPSYLPANGLVGWWPFNGNANDESGNGKNCTAYNSFLYSIDRFSKTNSSIYLLGDPSSIGSNGGYFEFPSNFVLDTNNFCINIWVKEINIYNAGESYIQFGLMQNPSTDVMIHHTFNDLTFRAGEAVLTLNNFSSISNGWHNYTLNYNARLLSVYIDGVFLGSNTNNGSIKINPKMMVAGKHWWTDSTNFSTRFTGYLDDITIYNRALTQAEISALYQNTIKLNLTTFLEGSYADSSSMTATANKINAAIPSSIADSIIVELHASTSPYATMYSSKGVVNTNGTASISFPNSTLDSSYYIVIKHRNSIETWSATPVTISNHTIYNFTTDASQAYGANLSNLGKGVFGIYSGDINQDGSIDFNDYPELDIASHLGVLGYDVNDLNGDASVDFNDYPILDINSNNGIIAMRP